MDGAPVTIHVEKQTQNEEGQDKVDNRVGVDENQRQGPGDANNGAVDGEQGKVANNGGGEQGKVANSGGGEQGKVANNGGGEQGKVANNGGEGSDDEEDAERKANFVPSEGLTTAEAETRLKEFGRNELEEKKEALWLTFLKLLWGPMPVMIWIAIIIEAAITNWADFGILLGIQFLNAGIAFYETTKAGNAVAALKASLKPEATVYRDGKWSKMDAATLVPGDMVLLAAGSAVPADCLVNNGQIDVDQSALTGESLPVTLYKADSAKMGSTVVRGEVEGTVENTGKNTFFGKTASLLQQSSEYSGIQKLLFKIMGVLVTISLTLCIIVLIYLLVKGEAAKQALSFTVVVLVASIPIAIEIVCTTTLALGSKELSKRGAIVTRLAAIEDMAGMNMLCSDKTGTLTLNQMQIQEDTPCYAPGENQYSILRYAAMAAKWKEPPRDALDKLTLTSADLASLEGYVMKDFMPFDPVTKRTEGTIQAPDGTVFKTTKGAPHVLLKLIKDEKLKNAVETDVHSFGLRGIRCLAVAKTTTEEEDWQFLGLLTFLDPPRPDTKDTIARAMKYGVAVKMITGDHLLIAKETARVLGLGDNVADAAGLPSLGADGKPPKDLGKTFGDKCLGYNGFAQVFPEHKFLIVETFRQMGFKVGMTGDGVNDAPALKRADVGVAVQGATDAARAAADIVLTEPGLSTIVDGITIARGIFARMKNFITYRIAATLQLLIFFFIAVLALPPVRYMPNPRPAGWSDGTWPNFFHMPVLMLMLITLLNDGTLISIGYDHVIPAKLPEVWNLKVVFTIACVLGVVACGSSLLLLWAALDSWNPHGAFAGLGIPGISYGQVTTMVYLKVSLSDFLTLFSARTTDRFFFQARPAPILFFAAMVSLAISTILASLWPPSYPDGIYSLGLTRREPKLLPLYIWIYCIIWWLIQDILKVIAYRLLKAFNIFDINLKKRLTADLGHAKEARAEAADEGKDAKAEAGEEEHELLESSEHDHGEGPHPIELQQTRRPSVEENVNIEMQAEKRPSRQPSRSSDGLVPVRRLSEAEMELVPADQKLAVRRLSGRHSDERHSIRNYGSTPVGHSPYGK